MKKVIILLITILFLSCEGDQVLINNAPKTLKKLMTERNLKLKDLTLKEGLELYNEYYSNYRFSECNLEEDGDMLLYEWGSYSWNNNMFQISLGRQFISSLDEGDDAFKQQHLVFLYPQGTFDKSVSGNKWFSDPNNIDEINKFTSEQDVFNSLLNVKPEKVEIDFEDI